MSGGALKVGIRGRLEGRIAGRVVGEVDYDEWQRAWTCLERE
jgi:hypothetical protein